jgi:general secretion pathway protein D
MKWLFISLFSFSSFAYNCPDLNVCVENISKLTNKKYITNEKLKGSADTTSNFEVTAENADTLLSQILQLNGYSRVPTDNKDVYLIVCSRDIRYYPGITYRADKNTTPAIPKNSDYSQLLYTFKHHLHGQSRDTANSLRPFMSRYGRIIEMKSSGTIVVHELNSLMPTVLEIARMNDRELSKDEIKKFEEQEKERKENMKAEKREERKNHETEKHQDKKSE